MEEIKEAKQRKIRQGSQSAKILAHMQAGFEITAKEAYEMFSCMTLAQRISDLKDAGHKIHTRTENVSKQANIAIYYMDF